ncbi:MAG: hypothetical protein JW967_05005 [Dehalococcoidales bacterium]|nr:hypothetical protein [Dehalococcoidales bacterium]
MIPTKTHKPNILNKTAQIISLLTNPPMLSVIVMLLISVTKAGTMLPVAGWWVEVVVFLVLLPLVYLFIRVITSGSQIKFPMGIISFLKQHPFDVLTMSLLLGIPCLVILILLGAPPTMYGTLVALLATSIIIASVYKFYRISYHVASTVTLVVMTAVTWGYVFSWLAVLIPVVGWAKYRLHEHSPAQMVIAAILSAVVVTITLFAVGIV